MDADNNLNSLKQNARTGNPWIMGPKDFVFKYLHYAPWVVVSLGLFLFLAYLKIRYSTPIYLIQSSLLIKNDAPNTSQQDVKFEQLFMTQGTLNLSNETEILKSRPLMQRVVKDLDLQPHIYNKGKVRSSLVYPNTPFSVDFLFIRDSSKPLSYKITYLNDQEFLLNENKTPFKFGSGFRAGEDSLRLNRNPAVNVSIFGSYEFGVTWQPISSAVGEFIGGLKVSQTNEQSTILSLSFESENISLGKDVLNTLMAVYDTLIVEDKNKIATNTLQFINARLVELNDTLSGVQGGLKNFMVANEAFDIEGQSKSYLEGFGESAKLRNEQEVRIKIVEWLLDYIGNQKNAFELVPTNLGIEEPALVQLITEYNRIQLARDANLKTTTRSNPLILQYEGALSKVRADIYEALKNVRQAYVIARNNIDKNSKDIQSRIGTLPGKSMRLINIQRQQKILEDLYSMLLQKKIEVSMSSASTISNSKVLEPAISSEMPSSPNKKKIYTFYFLIGLLIPVGVVGLKEIFQDKVASRMDVEKYTQTPVLGEIGHSPAKSTLVVSQNSRRFISEQFRIIRSNLQYIGGAKEKPIIMVTSSFSGEGKSFISTNVGAVMALTGKKTVIMEFDIRKPKIVSGLDLKRKMGITNYIVGKSRFDELLVKVEEVENLYVIPCGPIPPNPAELLLDPRLDDLMKEVIEKFEVIILDTAPVGLVSDAVNLGRFANCTLYIVRYRHTFKKQLGLIDELYKDKKLPGLCLVLNDVKNEGAYYSSNYYGGYGYYGQSYGYGGNSGYFEEEEKKGNFMRTITIGIRKLFKKKGAK